MENYTELLSPDNFYHIYNRSNGNEKLFFSLENYIYFLEKYKQYIHPFVDTYCYCLMPNHFHLLVKVKSSPNLSLDLTGFKNLSGLTEFSPNSISRQFSNLFNSYSKAINKQEGRKGNLFIRPFKRKKIDSMIYLSKLVHYIHHNPVEAGLCNRPEDYKFSSYSSLISNSKTLLKREEILSWFEDLENFKFVHNHPPSLTGIDLNFL